MNTAWDPVGLSGLESFDPDTDLEYAGYAQELTSMLARGADPIRIRKYLEWAEEYMGIDVSQQRIARVTDMLLSEGSR
ncbi:MAG TPA: hypothetical protein VN240_03975 [Propylenella sp.]|nr:hypothetical protein [Propylenella sp.]